MRFSDRPNWAWPFAGRRVHWVDIVGWAGTVGVLAAYATGSAFVFAWANALLFVPVALPAVWRRAWSPAAISITFGVLGWVHVLR